jgi:hypothetical protein
MNEFDSESMKHYLEMDYEINLKRVKLGFTDIVLGSFKFLIDDFGFSCVGSNLLLVKYESANGFVKIYHDRLSYELELYFGLKPDDLPQEKSYSLVEAMNLAGYPDFGNFQVITHEEMMEYVPKMAALFRQHALKAIKGEKEFYNLLAETQNEMSKNLMVEYTEKFIGKDVNKAWLKKDYKKVVKLYEMYEEFLTNDQKTKLEYAREQIKKKS